MPRTMAIIHVAFVRRMRTLGYKQCTIISPGEQSIYQWVLSIEQFDGEYFCQKMSDLVK